jgi:hypothetical protein
MRLWSLDRLPMARAFLTGPRWRSTFDVQKRSLAEIRPPWWRHVRSGRKWVWVFTLEEDVRERLLEELSPGVFAQWSDPREWTGMR